MARLIPLSDIPYAARLAEAAARRELGADALGSAHYRVEEAPGCYAGAFPATLGWTVTEAAAAALASCTVTMPGGAGRHTYRVI